MQILAGKILAPAALFISLFCGPIGLAQVSDKSDRFAIALASESNTYALNLSPRDGGGGLPIRFRPNTRNLFGYEFSYKYFAFAIMQKSPLSPSDEAMYGNTDYFDYINCPLLCQVPSAINHSLLGRLVNGSGYSHYTEKCLQWLCGRDIFGVLWCNPHNICMANGSKKQKRLCFLGVFNWRFFFLDRHYMHYVHEVLK